ncbi:hypothetical protein AB4308_20040, partial [Vibrio breoganii]
PELRNEISGMSNSKLSKRDSLLRSFVALGNDETQLEIDIPELRNEVSGISLKHYDKNVWRQLRVSEVLDLLNDRF